MGLEWRRLWRLNEAGWGFSRVYTGGKCTGAWIFYVNVTRRRGEELHRWLIWMPPFTGGSCADVDEATEAALKRQQGPSTCVAAERACACARHQQWRCEAFTSDTRAAACFGRAIALQSVWMLKLLRLFRNQCQRVCVLESVWSLETV